MEVVFNIWFIVDIESGLSEYVCLRPYVLSRNGIDDEAKFSLLSDLAEFDYLISKKIKLFDLCTTNKVGLDYFINGFINYKRVDSFVDECFHLFKDLINSNILDNQLSEENKLHLGDRPLFVCTLLMQNEVGEQRAFTSLENREWCYNQRDRLSNK